ncbi:MAG: penicillin-binding protein 2 [Cyanobacteria bacterium P01_F01_bin.33]
MTRNAARARARRSHARLQGSRPTLASGAAPSSRGGHGHLQPSPRTLHRRLAWFNLFWLGAVAIVSGRMVQLQLIEGPALKAQARAQQQARLTPFIPRRSIVDRRSVVRQEAELLAVDRAVYTLWAYPVMYQKRQAASAIAAKLAPVLEQSEEHLRYRLEKAQYPVRLERWVPEELAAKIRALRVDDGVELVRERQRIYPARNAAAEVVGYVDLDRLGKAGVELSWHRRLERTSREMAVPRDARGHLVAAAVPDDLLEDNETVLQLTLDMRLQRAAHDILSAQVERYQAQRGTAIVMDPDSGEILAMASSPTYDPNRYYDGYDIGLFRNWAVTDLYEPGSTFKPINIAIALDAGGIHPDTQIYDSGQIFVGGWPIQNANYNQQGAPGWLDVSQVLQRSSNVGTVRLMEKLPPQKYFEALARIGFGTKSGVDLPFEVASRHKNARQFTRYAIESATASFGQGLALTPLQLTQLHAAIANGGLKVTPRVVRGLVSRDTDTLMWQPRLLAPERIFSPETTHVVRTMMRDVVELGTGKSAAIPGRDIAGKTGTAQKANPEGGGYLDKAKIVSFVGYYPALEPRYVVLAVVDTPRGNNLYGSTVAAPIVKSLLREIISLEALEQPEHEARAQAEALARAQQMTDREATP